MLNISEGFTRSCFLLPQERVVWGNAIRDAIFVVLNINTQHLAEERWPSRSREEMKEGERLSEAPNLFSFQTYTSWRFTSRCLLSFFHDLLAPPLLFMSVFSQKSFCFPPLSSTFNLLTIFWSHPSLFLYLLHTTSCFWWLSTLSFFFCLCLFLLPVSLIFCTLLT